MLLFRRCGEKVSPPALNLFKNSLALLCLLATFPLVGEPFWPEIGSGDFLWLLASGALGIGLSDTLFFRALNLLGASRTAIVDFLYSPSVILSAWIFLGEKLSPWAWLGAGLVVAGVLLLDEKENAHRLSREDFRKGVGLGAVSMALMAVGIVAVKPILNAQSVLFCSASRMAGGVAVLLLFGTFSSRREEIFGVLRPSLSWKLLVPSAWLGGYLSLLLWIAGMKHTQTNISSILNQTSSVWIVILAAIFLREPLTLRKTIAAMAAFGGSLLVLL